MGGNDICKRCQLGVKEGGMGGVGGGWFCLCTVGHGEEERRRSSISPFVFWVLCASATAPQRLNISRSSELNSGKVGKKTKKKPPEEPHELAYRTTSSASATHLPNKQTNKLCHSPSLLRTTDRPHFAVFVFIYFSLNGKKRQPRSGEGSAPRDSRLVSRDGARG